MTSKAQPPAPLSAPSVEGRGARASYGTIRSVSTIEGRFAGENR